MMMMMIIIIIIIIKGACCITFMNTEQAKIHLYYIYLIIIS